MTRTQKGFKQQSVQKNGLSIGKPTAKNSPQNRMAKSWDAGKSLFASGAAGTGKTYMAIWLALNELQRDNSLKLLIIRSIVPSRDVGFLPGTVTEKYQPYITPYAETVNKLYGRGDAWQILSQHGRVGFDSTSFLRGTTLDNTIVILDEVQNLSPKEVHTAMTRVGENSRVILCGDRRQTDLRVADSGYSFAIDVANTMDEIDIVEFEKEHVLRSGFVRSWCDGAEMFERKYPKIYS